MNQSFIEFFGKGQTPFHFLIFTLVFIVCWNLEFLFGVSEKFNKTKHSITNLLFILPDALVQLFMGLLFAKVLIYENQNNIGLLPKLGYTTATEQIIVGFIALDLVYWLYHYTMHKFKFVWRFHAVHHSDKVMNVFTSLREHPVETFIRLGQYMLTVWILGPMFWLVTLHQFLQIVSKIVVHSNWRLPDKLDNALSWVLLTPNMHHVHHHHEQPYTDSNFGDLLSVWDHIFGTFYYLPKKDVVFGLDVDVFKTYESPSMQFSGLLKVPFSGVNLSNDNSNINIIASSDKASNSTISTPD